MFKEELKKELEDNLKDVPILYKYIDYAGGLKLLSNSNLLIKNPAKFNDPYDCYPGLINFDNMPDDFIKDLINKYYSHLSRQERKEKIISTIKNSKSDLIELFKTDFINRERQKRGITCFTEEHQNLLMWSQYAESHKGICVGFNLEKLYRSLKANCYNEITLLKVIYSEELQPLDYFEDEFKAVINWLRTKSNLWKYEKEIRISFGPIDFIGCDHKFVSFAKEAIEVIFVGSNMEEDKEKMIIQIADNLYNKADIFKMHINSTCFSLDANKIKN